VVALPAYNASDQKIGIGAATTRQPLSGVPVAAADAISLFTTVCRLAVPPLLLMKAHINTAYYDCVLCGGQSVWHGKAPTMCCDACI
jgi:hypothetical protein